MSDVAREILVDGAGALARGEGLRASLQALLGVLAAQLEAGSAAVFVPNDQDQRLEIVGSIGLGPEASAGLADAVANPGHPIARTMANPAPSFNVPPIAPGGPALRSHLPLIVTRAGTDTVLGVLALAHDRPFLPEEWPLLEAGGDLAAVAIELHRRLRAGPAAG